MYNLNTHAELWRIESPGGSAYPGYRIRTDGTLVYGSYLSGGVDAFAAAKPAVVWAIGDYFDQFWPGVAVASDRVFAAGQTGLYAIRK